MPHAVLFDLDNTLHDRDAGVRAFLAAQHRALDLERHGIALETWTSRFVALEERGRVWKDVVYRQLVEEFGLPHAADALLEEYTQGFCHHVVPYEGLHETLAALRDSGWRTGVVTNGRSTFQRATLAALQIEPLLDLVIVSEECGLRKPQREIFVLALERLGCSATDSWFIGDDPTADVEGARGAGMRALLFGPEGDIDCLARVTKAIDARGTAGTASKQSESATRPEPSKENGPSKLSSLD